MTDWQGCDPFEPYLPFLWRVSGLFLPGAGCKFIDRDCSAMIAINKDISSRQMLHGAEDYTVYLHGLAVPSRYTNKWIVWTFLSGNVSSESHAFLFNLPTSRHQPLTELWKSRQTDFFNFKRFCLLLPQHLSEEYPVHANLGELSLSNHEGI